jgi:simple sugar transport system permease protein
VLRAVGESPESAHALGYPVRASACSRSSSAGLCGISGAYISVVYTPFWVEGMVAGKGWIASRSRPSRPGGQPACCSAPTCSAA